jgi:hypothetical protein
MAATIAATTASSSVTVIAVAKPFSDWCGCADPAGTAQPGW